MRNVRKTWKVKPFTRIKRSEKVYKRAKEKDRVVELDKESEGRILALDFGEKRVGVAMSDPMKLTAQGLMTLTGMTTEEILASVEDTCRKYNISEIVLGYPLLMSGAEGEMAELVHQFAREIEKRMSIPVILWDERLSSKQAERVLRDNRIFRKKEDIDRVSACLILQSYLDSVAG